MPRRAHKLLATLALLTALALGAAGCRVGPAAQGSGASLTVTRDFGARALVRASEGDIPSGETAIRLLERRAEVETRYGGRFVNAVDGLRSGTRGGARRDWFYFVNGIEAEVGAAEKRLHTGDRVWWDYRDWSAAMRVPAVVGSFPEPFRNGADGKRFPVRIDCALGAEKTCRSVAERLDSAGAGASTTALGAPAGKEVLRLVVGVWDDVRRDSAARQIEDGPAKSGVFARLGPGPRGLELELLDPAGQPARALARGAGLVAATRFEEQQPTWVVTGIDALGLERAARLLSEPVLRDRFAVATDGRRVLALPLATGVGRGAGE
jgi:hypothetical protein